jgi:hypothetical protein
MRCSERVGLPASTATAQRRGQSREFGQDPRDLPFFGGLEAAQPVIGLHSCHRLDEDGSAGCGLIVHDAGELRCEFDADRHHVAPATNRDDRLRQHLRGVGISRDRLASFAHLVVKRPLLPADLRKRGRRAVGHPAVVFERGRQA